MIIDKRLKTGGIPIGRSEDEREPPKVKPKETHEWNPYCCSDRCMGRANVKSGSSSVRIEALKENVPYRKTFCPDCGYSLKWMREPIKKKNNFTVNL